MGTELKKVSLDFDWPLNKVWGGFKNPFYTQSIECPDCKGNGSSPEYQHLHDLWYGNAPFKPEDRGSKPFLPTDELVWRFAKRNVSNAPAYYGIGETAIMREAQRLCDLFNSEWMYHLNQQDVDALLKGDRLWDFTHIWTQGKGWEPKDPPYVPTPEEVNKWSISGFGHDSSNAWIVISAECDRLGYEKSCKHCDGEGCLWPTREIKQMAEDWTSIEPPTGEGYQIWETVSEGSPISPVFEKPEDLAEWMANHPWNTCDKDTTKKQWLKFILGPGWAPSFIGCDKGLITGVKAISEINK